MNYKKKKALKEQVFLKYNGRCAYCGIDLNNEIFHLDHFIPRRRYKYPELVSNGTFEALEVGRDTYENLMPCCVLCNSSKNDLTIEQFRDRVENRTQTLNKNSSEYRVAKRYGTVIETNKNVIFYFEKLNNG